MHVSEWSGRLEPIILYKLQSTNDKNAVLGIVL